MAKSGKQSKQQTTKYAPQAISGEDFVAGAIELRQRANSSSLCVNGVLIKQDVLGAGDPYRADGDEAVIRAAQINRRPRGAHCRGV